MIWSTRNETASSFLMEVCNAHPKATTTAALYEGKTAKGLLRASEGRFLNVEKNSVQADVTEFNSMKITSNQSGAEFVDSVKAQAKFWRICHRRRQTDQAKRRSHRQEILPAITQPVHSASAIGAVSEIEESKS